MTGPERDREMREVAREVLRELMPGVLRDAGSASGSGSGEGNGHSNGASQQAGNAHHHGAANGHGSSGRTVASSGQATVVPQVPAPPVAAVLRPSSWDRPPEPGEIIGATPHPSASPAPPPSPAAPPSSLAPRATPPAPQRPSPPSAPSPTPPDARAPAPALAVSGDERVEVVVIDTDEDLRQFIRQLMSRLESPRERLAIRTGRLRFQLRRSPAACAAGGASGSGPATRVEKGAVTERMIRIAAAEGTRLVLAPAAVLTPLAREQARARGVEIERERRC